MTTTDVVEAHCKPSSHKSDLPQFLVATVSSFCLAAVSFFLLKQFLVSGSNYSYFL